MDNKVGLISAYQLSVNIIELSLELIEKWECDTTLLEEILRINHRGWELFLKTSCFVFSETVPKKDDKEFQKHVVSKLLPKLQLDCDIQNLSNLFQSKMFRDYFQLLDNLFSDTESRYNVINDLLGKHGEHYVVDKWIRAQKLERDMYGSIRSRILDINKISLRCFYMNMVSAPDLRTFSVSLQKWSSYYHEWFRKCDIE